MNDPKAWVPVGPDNPGITAPYAGRPRRFRRKHGWLGLLVLILVVGGAEIGTRPWAFHIGGAFTPLASWTGVATGVTPGGQHYALQVVVGIPDRPACSQFGCDEVEGTVALCTVAARYDFDNMTGNFDGWASTEGHRMVLDVRSSKPGVVRNVQMTLRGVWHGNVFTVSDGGYLTRDFQPDGVPRTQVGPAQPSDAATFALTPGDFTKDCASVEHH